MPLESGKRRAYPPMGKGCLRARPPNLSGARDGLTTEGEEPKRFSALTRRGDIASVRSQPTQLRRSPHRPGRRCRRDHAQDHRRGVARRTGRQGAAAQASSTRCPPTVSPPAWISCRRPPPSRRRWPNCARMADANTVAVSMIGQGYFDTLTPPVLRRNILENPAWYTAYTPYQPEISQGRLEALLNFQTMVADLTGLEVANASMLDEGTAAAEAMTLMHRAVRGPSNRLAVDADVYRQTAAVLATRAEPLGIEIVTADLRARPARRRVLRRDRAAARRQRRGGRLDRVGGAGARARRAGRRRRRPAGADADHPARRDRCRRRVRQHPTFRCANGIRRTARRATWPCTPSMPASCPAGWSACHWTPTARRRTGWRCRPASSTSAATRPPAISAPRRCCWR